ncbi:hypothetical protein [Halostella sp. PRR32]|uniref:hypothetical protein n=1 Tax=Halostella sp. PRR32 TaxID=3098147 RepID=UPI002B1CEB6F|nr:hypothetical protein [Halostella sp. PRR32]
MDLPSPTESGGVFRYLMAFLLVILAILLLYALAVVAGLLPPPTWFPEPGTEGTESAVRTARLAAVVGTANVSVL